MGFCVMMTLSINHKKVVTMKRLKRIGIVLLALMVLCGTAVGIYAADYYHMDEQAVTAMAGSDTVIVTNEKGLAVFAPTDPKIGLVFYPGGKVEYTAYAPLMEMLADNGILCVIPKMPLNLAVMDMDAAKDILPQFPDIDTWYIGGHSLGGSMAASYAAESEDFAGLVLLASYSTADLSKSDLRALSIYGTRDGVLNMDSYKESLPNLPTDTTEMVLEGGNHAQFGSYGKQEGDGNPLIGEFEQQSMTASRIAAFMGVSKPDVPEYESEQYTFWIEQEGKSALRSVLTLIPETKQFVLSEPVYSSRFNGGSYAIENDILTCFNWNGDPLYRFDVTDYGMIYRAADSEDIYAHGSILDGDPNAQAPIPDGAVYGQLMICY